MDFLIKFLAILMLILLAGTQIVLLLPSGSTLVNDSFNGEPIKNRQSVIDRGSVTLNLLGEYAANSASLYINGRLSMVIQRFPLKLELSDGDVVEIHAGKQVHPFQIYISEKSSGLYTDMKDSTVKIKPGMNRVMRVDIRD